MTSLVGYGVSSDSESEGEDVVDNNVNKSNITTGSTDGNVGDVQKSRNFLLETGSDSSESEPEEDEVAPEPPRALLPRALLTATTDNHTPLLPPPRLSSLTPKLPPPSLGASSRSSVFANPFKAEADQKLNLLQKHVPLTLQAKPSQIAGKRMCVAYRKDGRCRFGIKCKFAHDSDLQSSIIPSDFDPPSADDSGAGSYNAGGRHNFHHHQGGEEEETEEQKARKRRVGLSNNLIPPKRAMKNFATQRERERVNLS